jgi:hypothetical protein
MVVHFPDLATLHAAVASGMIPATILAQACDAVYRADGVRVHSPAFDLPPLLTAIGARAINSFPDTSEHFDHWFALFPLSERGHANDEPPAEALLDLPLALFSVYAVEMMRLGNDRQSCLRVDEAGGARVLIRVINPPLYTLLRAVDGLDRDVWVYREASANVWVQWRYAHPFERRLSANNDAAWLVRAPRRWRAVDTRLFRDVHEVIALQPPAPTLPLPASALNRKIVVPLKLIPGEPLAPEFWMIRENALAVVDRFVRDADEATRARLRFAVFGQQAALRDRRVGDRPAGVELPEAVPSARHGRLPRLYLPVGERLHPRLSAERTRELLCPDDARVVWLTRGEGGSILRESLPDDAFAPLSDWVEFILDREQETLRAWINETTCDFGEWITASPVIAEREAPPRARAPTPPPSPPAPEIEELPPELPKTFAPAPAESPIPRGDLAQARDKLEKQLLDASGPDQAATRESLWPKLARINAELGDLPEAAICWAHALWDRDPPPADWLAEWRDSEWSATSDDLAACLAKPDPTHGDARRVAVHALRAATLGRPTAFAPIGPFLDKHASRLGVRLTWLAWRALTRACDDPLALARVRDRLLERLMRDGLRRQHDVPDFIHFAGQRDSDRLRQAQDLLWSFRADVQSWLTRQDQTKDKLHRSLATTGVYADLLFAYGFARLGEERHRAELADGALATLRANADPVVQFLADAFAFRIDQAGSGGTFEPLPAAITARLERFDPGQRYAVSRLRQQLIALEPSEKSDPYLLSKTAQAGSLGRDLLALSAIRDPKRLQAESRRVLNAARQSPDPAERLIALTEITPLSLRGGREFAAEMVEQAGAALKVAKIDGPLMERQARLVDALMPVAASYEWADKLREILGVFARNLRTLDELQVIAPVNLALGRSLRAARRCGMGEQLHALMNDLTELLTRGRSIDELRRDYRREALSKNWVDMLQALTRVAEYWFHFGSADRAAPFLEEARRYLLEGDRKERPAAQRDAGLARAYLQAVGQHSDLPRVIASCRELFERLRPFPNAQTTSVYYSSLHLGIVETLVLTLVSDDFVLAQTAKRWLDDDEHLVRRRIHADTITLRSD